MNGTKMEKVFKGTDKNLGGTMRLGTAKLKNNLKSHLKLRYL